MPFQLRLQSFGLGAFGFDLPFQLRLQPFGLGAFGFDESLHERRGGIEGVQYRIQRCHGLAGRGVVVKRDERLPGVGHPSGEHGIAMQFFRGTLAVPVCRIQERRDRRCDVGGVEHVYQPEGSAHLVQLRCPVLQQLGIIDEHPLATARGLFRLQDMPQPQQGGGDAGHAITPGQGVHDLQWIAQRQDRQDFDGRFI